MTNREQLEDIRAQLVRLRGFNRSVETMATKAIEAIDAIPLEELPVDAPPVVVEPEPPAPPEAGAGQWTLPAGAVVRHVTEGQELRIRNGQSGTAEAPVIYDLQGQTITWLRIYNGTEDKPTQHVHVINGRVDASAHEVGLDVLGSYINDLHFHNLIIENAHVGIRIQTISTDGPLAISRIKLTDCTVRNNYQLERGAGHSQGAYFERVVDLVVQGCTFDANGWIPSQPKTATIYNHHVYANQLQQAVFRDNRFTRGPSFVFKVNEPSSDIRIEGNYVDGSANGITLGSNSGRQQGNVGAVIRGNTLLNIGREIYRGTRTDEEGNVTESWQFQGFGIHLDSAKDVVVEGNTITPNGGAVRDAITVDADTSGVIVAGNDLTAWERE